MPVGRRRRTFHPAEIVEAFPVIRRWEYHRQTPSSPLTHASYFLTGLSDADWERARFVRHHRTGTVCDDDVVGIPYWALAISFAVLPALAAATGARRVMRCLGFTWFLSHYQERRDRATRESRLACVEEFRGTQVVRLTEFQ